MLYVNIVLFLSFNLLVTYRTYRTEIYDKYWFTSNLPSDSQNITINLKGMNATYCDRPDMIYSRFYITVH